MGISIRHDTAGIGGGGGAGGGRGGKYGLDYMLQKQKMAQDVIENEKARIHDMNMVALRDQAGIQEELRLRGRMDLMNKRQDKLIADQIAREDAVTKARNERRDFEFKRQADEFDRRRQAEIQELEAERIRQAQEFIPNQLRKAIEQGRIRDPALIKSISEYLEERRQMLSRKDWDDTNKEEYIMNSNAIGADYLAQASTPPDQVKEMNKGVFYRDRKSGQYSQNQTDNADIYDSNLGKLFPGQLQEDGPLSPEEYYRQNPDAYKKDLSNAMNEIINSPGSEGLDHDTLMDMAHERLVKNYTAYQDFISGKKQRKPDPASQVADLFDKNNPEQNAELVGQIEQSGMLDDLIERSLNGDEEAAKILDSMERAIPIEKKIDSLVPMLQSDDSNAVKSALSRMDNLRKNGQMDNYAYMTAMLNATGKTAHDVFKNLNLEDSELKSQLYYNDLGNLAAELGLRSSRPYVRFFQGLPSEEEVVKAIAKQGKMSEKDAKEYMYKYLLSQSFIPDVREMYFDKKLRNQERKSFSIPGY
jgi:hypothetical protein